MNWDCFLMSMAYFVSMKSKDNSTHIGAIIVDDKHRPLSWGYNSFPMGINDNIKERQERPEKYFWMEHAERNSIILSGKNLDGATIYTQGIPCMDCARAIVQSGIKKVVVHKQWIEDDLSEENIWNDHSKRTLKLFEESKVSLRIYDGPIIENIISNKRNKNILEKD